MARRMTGRAKAIVSAGLHPHYVSVCTTMAKFTGDVLAHEAPKADGAGDFAALPSRAYAIGFTRTFAKAVGLDDE
jgi:glycine dehydrogenase subunit 1